MTINKTTTQSAEVFKLLLNYDFSRPEPAVLPEETAAIIASVEVPENDDGSADATEIGGLWDGSCREKWRLPAPASASLQDIVHLQADILAVV